MGADRAHRDDAGRRAQLIAELFTYAAGFGRFRLRVIVMVAKVMADPLRSLRPW